MRLINTIEFSPYSYNLKDHKSPDYTDSNDVWYNYWKNCLADSGIVNIDPIDKRSWLVDIDTIDDQALTIFVQKTFEEGDYDSIEKNIYGGIVLFQDNEIVLSTNCCGDLSNLSEWENIFIPKSEEWKMLWIGHPFVYYRYANNYIEFSHETEGSADTTLQMKLKVSEIWLKQQIETIRKKQNILIKKIEDILKNNIHAKQSI